MSQEDIQYIYILCIDVVGISFVDILLNIYTIYERYYYNQWGDLNAYIFWEILLLGAEYFIYIYIKTS